MQNFLKSKKVYEEKKNWNFKKVLEKLKKAKQSKYLKSQKAKQASERCLLFLTTPKC